MSTINVKTYRLIYSTTKDIP